MAYNYSIEYRSSADHQNADALSRLPLQAKDRTAEEANIFYFSVMPELPVCAKDIEQATRKDPVLSKVWRYTQKITASGSILNVIFNIATG